MISHKVMDPALEVPKDADSAIKIRDMKARAKGFAEPLFSLINDIDESLPVSVQRNPLLRRVSLTYRVAVHHHLARRLGTDQVGEPRLRNGRWRRYRTHDHVPR